MLRDETSIGEWMPNYKGEELQNCSCIGLVLEHLQMWRWLMGGRRNNAYTANKENFTCKNKEEEV